MFQGDTGYAARAVSLQSEQGIVLDISLAHESFCDVARMKLIGSRVEQQMRAELARSNLALRNGGLRRLASVLETAGVNLTRAYIVAWIPEQAEDICTVLVSAEEVVIVEVPRKGGEASLERQALSAYERSCSKIRRLKIAVARDLLASANSVIAD